MGDQANDSVPMGRAGPAGGRDSTPFHSQLQMDNASERQSASSQHPDMREQQPFDMSQMMGALPFGADQYRDGRRPSFPYNNFPSAGHFINPAQLHYVPHMQQYGQQRHDPAFLARQQVPQPQQYPMQHYGPQPGHYHSGSRPHPMQLQTQHPYGHIESYNYTMNHPNLSPTGGRVPQQLSPTGYVLPTGYAERPNHAQRQPESPAIPSFPRGPPRKPKQSGHALWVGNLPQAATVTDLKEHFSRDARTQIESLFLISKSNCAFVNYRSEAACVAAMNRFHDSRFHGVRLVCRLRRGSTATDSAQPSPSPNLTESTANLDESTEDQPTIVNGTPTTPQTVSEQVADSLAPAGGKTPEKFFIVKSLTIQDLEASVSNGIWATQSHNEPALNRAFSEADNVYLIFSANKSGEYFGYARMESAISGEPTPNQSSNSAPAPRSPVPTDGPRSIPTPATEHAPRGRIIDDSGRGTIFWEAELSDEEGEPSPTKETSDNPGNSEMGRPFKISWVSTARLPFYRTRGLRNPWNVNREVKIARDGTELEPTVGKRLIQMFHRPAQMTGVPSMPPAGLPYHMG